MMTPRPHPGCLYQTLPTEELEKVKAAYNTAYQDETWKKIIQRFRELQCDVNFTVEYADGSSKTFIVVQ
jgi:hypothetical protein